jgi:nucleotide-binding universal stress UspA family protein
MNAMKKLLVPTDFSDCAAHALAYAIELAQPAGAEVHLLHVFAVYDPELHGTVEDSMEASQRREQRVAGTEQELQALAAQHQAAGVVIETEQRRSMAVPAEIIAYAHEKKVDVIGTHGRSGVKHFLLGSVAEQVVNRAPCDVLTVGAACAEDVERSPVRRILVPVDLSEFSGRLLQEARAAAHRYGAALDVLFVLEHWPLPILWVGPGTVNDLVPSLRRQAQRHLEELVEATPGPDVPVTLHIQEGRPAATITDFAAKQDTDLIVIATHGVTGLGHFFIGSVTERVVRTAPCPVLTVKMIDADVIEAGTGAQAEATAAPLA